MTADTYGANYCATGFVHFLATRDLSAFNPNGYAPDTPDKKVVQEATRGGWEAWLDDALESEASPFDKHVVNTREALEKINDLKGPRMTVQQISGFLKKRLGEECDLGRVRMPNGNRVRCYAVREVEVFANNHEAAAKAYRKPIDFELMRAKVRIAAE